VSVILFATDLHGNRGAYERLFGLEADAIVLGGDLLPYPLKRGGDLLEIQAGFVRDYLGAKMKTRPCYWIPGNDDWATAVAPLADSGTALHGRAVPFLDGTSIAGYGCVPVTPFGMKDYDRVDVPGWEPKQLPKSCLWSTPTAIEEVPLKAVMERPSIEADLDQLATLSDPSRTIYVVHTPPYATALDRLLGGPTPIGSRALKKFIEKRQPPLTLHGHVHESSGMERIGRTISVNPGDSRSRFRGVRIDLATFEVTPVA